MDSGVLASMLQHPLVSAVVVLDARGRPLAANRAAQMLGLPATLSAYVSLLAEQRELLVIEGGACSCVIPGPDGISLDACLRAIGDEQGEVLAFTLSVLDPLSLSHGLASGNSPGTIEYWTWDCDMGSDRVFYSARGRQPYACANKKEAVAKEVQLYSEVHPEDRRRVENDMRIYLSGEASTYSTEFRVPGKDGEWCWVLDYGRIVSRAGDGRPLQIMGRQLSIESRKLLELQLQQQRIQIEEMQRISNVASWSWECVQDKLTISPDFLRKIGFSQSRLHSIRSLFRLLGSSSRTQLRVAWQRIRRECTSVQFEIELKATEGSVHLRVWVNPASNDDELLHVDGLVQNITEQRQTEALIRWRTELLNRVSEMGEVGGCEIELGTRRMQWTEQCYRIHGLRKEQITLDQVLDLYTQDSRDAFEAALLRIADGGLPEQLELCFYRSSGRRVWVQVLVDMDRRDGLPPRYIALLRDITREREANERIERLSHYDILTGLPNRFLLRDQVESAMRETNKRSGRLAMLMVNLDGFKSINESYGHAVGDTLMKQAAVRLHQHLRNSDLFARFGGDEFVVVLRDLFEPEDAGHVARKLISALAEPLRREHVSLKVGVCVGIALQDDNLDDFDSLLRAADAAMYAARESGRNTYNYYSQDVLLRTQRRLELEHALQGALDREEFSLVYQPLINVSGTAPPAIEALLRWNRPGCGFCSPAEFIPIAEDCGEIVQLGDWVLNEACRQAVAWDRAGLRFGRISVNVSAVQLRNHGFAERVLEICAEHCWPPNRLELELTESALIRDSDVLRHCFELFKSNGVLLAVDDFGTGFSNLHYLNRFPVQRLKIDRSFVQGMLEDANTAEVTQAIVHLGHALGMQVVAEGVETLHEDAMLRRQGCDEIQGYLYSRPLSPRDMGQWLRGTDTHGYPYLIKAGG